MSNPNTYRIRDAEVSLTRTTKAVQQQIQVIMRHCGITGWEKRQDKHVYFCTIRCFIRIHDGTGGWIDPAAPADGRIPEPITRELARDIEIDGVAATLLWRRGQKHLLERKKSHLIGEEILRLAGALLRLHAACKQNGWKLEVVDRPDLQDGPAPAQDLGPTDPPQASPVAG